jgi:hypothetical protein
MDLSSRLVQPDLLKRCCHALQVPFEFHGVGISGNDIEVEHLGIAPGETIAVNFTPELHPTPDDVVSTANHWDRVLRQGAHTRGAGVQQQHRPFAQRFAGTLDCYTRASSSPSTCCCPGRTGGGSTWSSTAWRGRS